MRRRSRLGRHHAPEPDDDPIREGIVDHLAKMTLREQVEYADQLLRQAPAQDMMHLLASTLGVGVYKGRRS